MEQHRDHTPSIPICQKQKNGIEVIFVDKEALLPHNHRLPAASGNVGVVPQIGIIQDRQQKGGVRSKNIFQVLRLEDPYTRAPASGDRKRDLNACSTV